MPVIRPPENKSLEFISAISSLYYKQRDHYRIALKRIAFFLDRIAIKYKLDTEKLDERLVEQLAQRSGREEGKVKQLIQLISVIRETKQVSEMRLKELVSLVELFNDKK